MSGFRVALIGLFFSFAVAPVRAADLRVARHVAVAVCDLEGVPNLIMRVAEEVAGEVYRDIGIALDWADNECHPGEGVFAVSIVSRAVADMLVTDHTLGFAESGTREATVLYDHVKRFSRRYHVNRGVLLGYVMAHELGHLLLPPKSHSTNGVMRGTLDLQLASKRQLRFTPDQGALIVRRVAAASRYTAAARPQNCCDASRAPSDLAASLPQTTSGSTASRPTHVP